MATLGGVLPRSGRELAAVWAYPAAFWAWFSFRQCPRKHAPSGQGAFYASRSAKERPCRCVLGNHARQALRGSTRTGADVLLDAAGQRRSERSPGRAPLRTGRCTCRGARSDAVAGQARVYRHRLAPAIGECRRMVVGRPLDRRRFRPPVSGRLGTTSPPCGLRRLRARSNASTARVVVRDTMGL